VLARKNGEITTTLYRALASPRRTRGSIPAEGWFIGPHLQSAVIDGPPSAGFEIVSQQATLPVAVTPEAAVVAALGRRSVVLVGMMGAGKSSIGRRVALRMGVPFVDADAEIEKAAQMTIPELFARRGEAEFRAGEARVILRLLESGPQVLATGGGAFINPDTRAAIGAKGISIWLKADLDVLMKRIRRRHDRPLLKTDDPGATLRQLIDERYPIYALADLTVQSREVPHDKIVDEIVDALAGRIGTSWVASSASVEGDRVP
jgi:shikimate kinase